MKQPEGEGERHEGGEDAPPEDELVGDPAGARSPADEPLGEQLRADESGQGRQVGCLALPEGVPSTPIEHRRRWSTHPHGVAIDHAEHGEDQPEQVADESGVEPHQAVATDEREGDDDRHSDRSPDHSASIERRGLHRVHRIPDRAMGVLGTVRGCRVGLWLWNDHALG